MESTTLVNRVADSGIITINLEEYFPTESFGVFDIKDHLFHGLILKEKEFREALKSLDWSVYKNKIVLVICSADAIIPLWAYMLVEVYLHGIAADTYQGTDEDYLRMHFRNVLNKIDFQQYNDKRVVIKGCSHRQVPSYAYGLITSLLKPHAQSIMFGEPCSTVPIFKRPRAIP
ncbi:MAG: DUF2480 family protein [Saprospiraceae bacterium]|nr:DUF2480 family protein [Saprospiraceae bacterium]